MGNRQFQFLTHERTKNIRDVVKGNVLVVEDDADLNETLILALSREGYGVRSAVTRESAVLALDCHIYQAVILDYMMPGLTCRELIEQLKNDCPNTAVILISGKRNVADIAAELGVQHYLAKPFTPAGLLQKLEEATQSIA